MAVYVLHVADVPDARSAAQNWAEEEVGAGTELHVDWVADHRKTGLHSCYWDEAHRLHVAVADHLLHYCLHLDGRLAERKVHFADYLRCTSSE